MRFTWSLAVFLLLAPALACTTSDLGDDDDGADALPEFAEDCGSGINDRVEDASGLEAENHKRYEGVRLCSDDVDYYRIDVPAGRWMQVTIEMESGSGQEDLDMYEVDAEDEEIWWSATAQPFERLAWFNPSEEVRTRYLRVAGYDGARGDYDIEIRTSSWHEGLDCDPFYPDEDPEDEEGPCNRIMQFPQTNSDDEGYFVEHEPHYSSLRREVAYLVRWAARETAAQFEDTEPLGLLDMSQWDGDTPGRMRGQLRHPEGTHVYGNDIDISYYSLSPGNGGKIICSQDDNYFCTGPADDLDVDRTTYFLAMLMESDYVRVAGVDPEVAELVEPRAYELQDEGLISNRQRQKVQGLMAYGDGWPFHHHHIHLSWQWEDGFEGRSETPDGCMVGPDL